jgi:hypothetical protein
VRRQTGRHHAAGPTPRTQFRAKDGAYVCALVAGRLTPKYIGELANQLDTNRMAGDLRDPKYQDPAVIAANTSHIIDDLAANFIASLPAEERRGSKLDATDTPKCPICKTTMVPRSGPFGDFWGCPNYPTCKEIVTPTRPRRGKPSDAKSSTSSHVSPGQYVSRHRREETRAVGTQFKEGRGRQEHRLLGAPTSD